MWTCIRTPGHPLLLTSPGDQKHAQTAANPVHIRMLAVLSVPEPAVLQRESPSVHSAQSPAAAQPPAAHPPGRQVLCPAAHPARSHTGRGFQPHAYPCTYLQGDAANVKQWCVCSHGRSAHRQPVSGAQHSLDQPEPGCRLSAPAAQCEPLPTAVSCPTHARGAGRRGA